MHDTARCLGYPSDSTRAARERASGDNLQSPCGPTLLAPVAHLSPPWLNSRPGGSTLVLVAQPRLSSPRWLNSPPAWLNSRTPGRRRQSAASHWPWAFSPGAPASVSDQTRPQRRCRRDRRAAGGGPELARAAGGLRRAVYYSLSPGRRRRSATSQLALDVQSGLLAFGPDQTRPQRHCRRDRRAVGGGPGLARIAGGSPDAS